MRHGNGLNAKTGKISCLNCNIDIQQKPGSGRAKLYCSENCRKAFNREPVLCVTCGKEIVGRKKLYCSPECLPASHGKKRSPKGGTCPVCRTIYVKKGRQLYCSNSCQKKAGDWKRKYGLDVHHYRFMWMTQGGRCKICRTEAKEFGDLYVDHDHATNEVRGLLCPHCNSGLGMFRDNIDYLKQAIRYLNTPVFEKSEFTEVFKD